MLTNINPALKPPSFVQREGDGGREGGKEGGREGGREGGAVIGREGEREREWGGGGGAGKRIRWI